jgi:hypothetical protein
VIAILKQSQIQYSEGKEDIVLPSKSQQKKNAFLMMSAKNVFYSLNFGFHILGLTSTSGCVFLLFE